MCLDRSLVVKAQEASRLGRPFSDEFLMETGGAFVYLCRIDPDSASFLDGTRIRAGVVFIVPTASDDGSARISIGGKRVAVSYGSDDTQRLPKPCEWSATGTLRLHEDRPHRGALLVFTWESSGEHGYTSEEILISTNTAKIWPGEFEHTRKDGEKVRGTVSYGRFPEDLGLGSLFDSIPNLYRGTLTNDDMANWGRRLFELRYPNGAPADSKPCCLIDVISGNEKWATIDNRMSVALEMRREYPHAMVYSVDVDSSVTPSLRSGSGL